MTSFESLIADFSQKTGLGLVPDERAGCILETDGIFITLQHRAESDDVVVFAPVTDPEAAARPTRAMLERALSLAYDGRGTYGAFLGLFDGELILSVHLPMQGLDAETLAARLTAFADAAVSVRAEVAAAAVGGEDGETAAEGDGVDLPGGGVSQFIPV